MPSPVRTPEDVESAEQKLAGGIAGADLRAAGGLSKAKTALAKTEEQLRRAQRVGSYTRPGYSLHELELAQREDEQLVVSVCMRMKQRDEARRKLRARELEMGDPAPTPATSEGHPARAPKRSWRLQERFRRLSEPSEGEVA